MTEVKFREKGIFFTLMGQKTFNAEALRENRGRKESFGKQFFVKRSVFTAGES
ncbi:hypothetical protein [Desulfuromonas soudanensis]|uniref:hypothetical protein n=1 Tax=Desulfuromonas soudanensis TaxID=1603606 RepID=UPI000B2A4222|nr:hypothetical protein [Desulfuromonas soudanensis]